MHIFVSICTDIDTFRCKKLQIILNIKKLSSKFNWDRRFGHAFWTCVLNMRFEHAFLRAFWTGVLLGTIPFSLLCTPLEARRAEALPR